MRNYKGKSFFVNRCHQMLVITTFWERINLTKPSTKTYLKRKMNRRHIFNVKRCSKNIRVRPWYKGVDMNDVAVVWSV